MSCSTVTRLPASDEEGFDVPAGMRRSTMHTVVSVQAVTGSTSRSTANRWRHYEPRRSARRFLCCGRRCVDVQSMNGQASPPHARCRHPRCDLVTSTATCVGCRRRSNRDWPAERSGKTVELRLPVPRNGGDAWRRLPADQCSRASGSAPTGRVLTPKSRSLLLANQTFNPDLLTIRLLPSRSLGGRGSDRAA